MQCVTCFPVSGMVTNGTYMWVVGVLCRLSWVSRSSCRGVCKSALIVFYTWISVSVGCPVCGSLCL